MHLKHCQGMISMNLYCGQLLNASLSLLLHNAMLKTYLAMILCFCPLSLLFVVGSGALLSSYHDQTNELQSKILLCSTKNEFINVFLAELPSYLKPLLNE